MEAPRSISDAIEWLRKSFRADAAQDVRVVYQIELSGPDGGALFARVDEGRLDVSAGRASDADAVLRLEATDFFEVLSGVQNPDLLFMEERLRIDGDLSMALKLRKLFRRAGP